jgi:hypothetical protein
MGRIQPIARRELFVDGRGSALRASWHQEEGLAVISLWHGDLCVGTVRLDAQDSARLAQFLVGHLGELATDGDA